MRRERPSHRVRSWLAASGFVAMLFGAATSAVAGDWYVDAQAPDCLNANGSASLPYCTIGEAVLAAASSDVIHVAPGSYFECVTLDKSLKLVGDSGASVTTVDGGGLGSVFVVTAAAAVEIEGLTITHGKARFGGGLHLDNGCGATVTSCVLTSNQAEAVDGLGTRLWSLGGGIYAGSSTLNIVDSTISDNSSNAGGGGIYFEGGAPFTTSGSVVSNNVAGGVDGYSTFGGGLDVQVAGYVRITETTIEANRLEGPDAFGGGGMYCDSNDARLDHLVVRGNFAPTGGGLFLSWQNSVLADSLLEGNSAVDEGGGAYVLGYSDLQRCVIRGNVCSGSRSWWVDGGGLAVAANVTDCRIEDNVVESKGGGEARGGGLC
jgi:hypothetical protein